MSTFYPVQGREYQLSGSGITSTATSIILKSMKQPDNSTNLTMTDFGSIGYGVLEPGTVREENISFTGITQNADGTATLTGVTRGLKFVNDYTQDISLRKAHAGGTIFRLSNTVQFYDKFVNTDNAQSITGVKTFVDTAVPRMDTAHTYGSGEEEYFATKRYADSLAIAGAPNASTTQKGIVEMATSAESKTGTDTGGTGALTVVAPSDIAANVQNSSYSYAIDTGAADAYVIALTPAVSAYAAGQTFIFKATNTNTGASTINVNGLGSKTILKNGSDALEAGDIISGGYYIIIYDGTNFQLQSPQSSMPTTAILNEMNTFFSNTNITGAEAETLTDGSDASALHIHQRRTLGITYTATTVSGTTSDTTVLTQSIPAGALGTNNGVKVAIFFNNISMNSYTATGYLKYKGTTVASFPFASTVKTSMPVYMQLLANGATNSQKGIIDFVDTDGTHYWSAVNSGTAAVDSTTAGDLTVTITPANTLVSITMYSAIVELL